MIKSFLEFIISSVLVVSFIIAAVSFAYAGHKWNRWTRGFKRGRASSEDFSSAIKWSAILGVSGLIAFGANSISEKLSGKSKKNNIVQTQQIPTPQNAPLQVQQINTIPDNSQQDQPPNNNSINSVPEKDQQIQNTQADSNFNEQQTASKPVPAETDVSEPVKQQVVEQTAKTVVVAKPKVIEKVEPKPAQKRLVSEAQEAEIIKLHREGLSVKDISKQLLISRKTVSEVIENQ